MIFSKNTFKSSNVGLVVVVDVKRKRSEVVLEPAIVNFVETPLTDHVFIRLQSEIDWFLLETETFLLFMKPEAFMDYFNYAWA